jgi:hypothetical protein
LDVSGENFFAEIRRTSVAAFGELRNSSFCFRPDARYDSPLVVGTQRFLPLKMTAAP